jgi:uncharacterized protein YheU (UPF0270 family)
LPWSKAASRAGSLPKCDGFEHEAAHAKLLNAKTVPALLAGGFTSKQIAQAAEKLSAPRRKRGRKPLDGNAVSVWMAVCVLKMTTGKSLTWVCGLISKRLEEREGVEEIMIDTKKARVLWEKLEPDTIERIFRRVNGRRGTDADFEARTDQMLETYLEQIKVLDPAALLVLPYRMASTEAPDRAALVDRK